MFPEDAKSSFRHPALPELAQRIKKAAENKASVIFAAGAHVLRRGNGPLLIDLMERGLLTHLALNGAGAIHDFEFALIGKTCESVARYIKTGEFGLWKETGGINDAVTEGCNAGLGFGESVGKWIEQGEFQHRQESVLAAGFRLGIPVTVHVSIGQDIIHQHPNFDAAAAGQASYRDFLIFTDSVNRLEKGVFLNIGTAVMGPEVYLKALAMARNLAHQEGRLIKHFSTAVFDLQNLDLNGSVEAGKEEANYYFRPLKTILHRTVADGGESFYIQGDHRDTVPALFKCLSEEKI